jgi:hypothetical protein
MHPLWNGGCDALNDILPLRHPLQRLYPRDLARIPGSEQLPGVPPFRPFQDPYLGPFLRP